MMAERIEEEEEVTTLTTVYFLIKVAKGKIPHRARKKRMGGNKIVCA